MRARSDDPSKAIAGTSEGDGAGARPRLAVLMPVYNNQQGLERSLESLRHDGAAFDIVVVDDGSEPPIRVPGDLPLTVTLVRLARNRGIAGALNAGLERITATGYEYIARLDAGDLSLPGRFTAQMAFLDRHPDHAVVGTQTEGVDAAGRFLWRSRRPTDHEALMRYCRYRTPHGHPTVMIRVAALREAGFYSDRYPGAEDYELWLRLAKRWKLANLDCTGIKYEIGPRQLSARKLRLAWGRLLVLLRHFSPWSVHAYLGLIRNVIALFVPRRVTTAFRRAHARWSATRRPDHPTTAADSDRLAAGQGEGRR